MNNYRSHPLVLVLRVIVPVIFAVGWATWNSQQRAQMIKDNWKPVQAVVQDARLLETDWKGEKVSMLTVDYDYTMGKQVFHGSKRFQTNEAAEASEHYKKGTKFTVYSNPEDPASSRLESDLPK
ncbi:MAG: DUF3592 domain-containing protein [Candidatus Obscuribacterales bacterium]|nr:DUF3592 domain-containing protein [Cyanobacteria bacterium HKST-UBA01]MCB9471601.1 DUF3592 domain-containing protein [Candidatus Obscuribacterales bacterium]